MSAPMLMFLAATAAAAAPTVPAVAQSGAQQPVLTRDFARSDRLVLRSPALSEEVAIRIRYPALGVTRDTVILVALLPQPDVARIAADLRRRELETSTFGVLVVSLDALGPLNGDTLAADLVGPVRADQPTRFTRFLADELLPMLQEKTKPGGKSLVAGSGDFGRAVLQGAVEKRGTFDEYVVIEPEVDVATATLLARKATGDVTPMSNLNLLRPPAEEGSTRPLDQLLEALGEGPFSIEVRDLGEESHSASNYAAERAAQMAIVPPF